MGILNVKALKDWILLRAVNHMLATEKGFFMDARLGPVIQGELDKLKTSVNEINGNLQEFKFICKNDTNIDSSMTVKQIVDNIPTNTLFVYTGWNPLPDYPTIYGGLWVLEILKGSINVTRILLSNGPKLYSGYYTQGTSERIIWYEATLAEK